MGAPKGDYFNSFTVQTLFFKGINPVLLEKSSSHMTVLQAPLGCVFSPLKL